MVPATRISFCFIIFATFNQLSDTRGDSSEDKDEYFVDNSTSQKEVIVSLAMEINSLASSIRQERSQRESTISRMAALEHAQTTLRGEARSIQTALKNMSLVTSQIQEKCGCHPVPRLALNHPTTCSTYKPSFEFVSNADLAKTEVFNNTPAFTGDTLCKGFVGDEELLGRGHLNNCWGIHSKGEYPFPFGLGTYHLRQPLGVRLEYVPASQILDGVKDWIDVERSLLAAKAVNVASKGNLRRGYAGRCNAAGSTKPETLYFLKQ
ncbi:hypothetical protein Fcan01_18311 [Folsomia candida]|uniref:Uncharacterized protein n=1 Tax=Folsomia candida TaxID=158441 RepID=A0A226DNN2_FOLCA|nr:hypothetical protein Fcan01_18311 [Folsomia candida]